MPLKLFNTLSRKNELFRPIRKGRVGIYSCGPTVYHYAHIGNLRSYVTADVLKRALIYGGMSVDHVINITDVGHLTSDGDEGEDKIEVKAREEQKSARDIARFYTKAFLSDLKRLNVVTKGVKFPRASAHIKEQIRLIKTLEKKGFVYRTSDGMYFNTAKFKRYGMLAQLDLKGLRAGARIGPNMEKRNPSDFALWKFSPERGKRMQEWQSPWGVGFPGWHLECSTMSMKYLGKHFDIHTGGIDHIPVHHTNEIAQSESATGRKFVNYWIHNEFVTMAGEKMAKSLGNILTLKDLAREGISPAAYRYWLLTAHYRSPISFRVEAVRAAETALNRLIATLTSFPSGGAPDKGYAKKFQDFISDDLDTPQTIALVWELLKDERVSPRDKRATILLFDTVLGLNVKKLLKQHKEPKEESVPQRVQELLNEREGARAARDWTTADRLRAEIKSLGYEVQDTDTGPKLARSPAM